MAGGWGGGEDLGKWNSFPPGRMDKESREGCMIEPGIFQKGDELARL